MTIARIRSRCHILLHQVLMRTIPHTVTSWRFLLPGQSAAVRLHRQVFLQAWPQLPRLLWFGIAVYSLLTWWLFFSGYYSLRCCWRYRHIDRPELQHTLLRQWLDLTRLTLLHGIPPGFYYQYRLYQYPDKQWLDFIYTHQLPHWHHVLALDAKVKAPNILNNKQRCAQKLNSCGLTTVATRWFLHAGDSVPETTLFCQHAWFIKPNQGHGANGCLVLDYDQTEHSYQLRNFLDDKILAHSTTEILAYIHQRQQQQDLLIQDYLHNHPAIEALIGKRPLMTIRVISARLSNRYQLVYALLEIPLLTATSAYLLIPVDCTNGCLLSPNINSSSMSKQHDAEIQTLLPNLVNTILPFWPELSRLCCQAHEQIGNLVTIAWDVVIIPEGVSLLEGNVNWAVAAHQIVGGQAALQGKLLAVYSEHIGID